jgi:hypothetical protein
VGDVSEIMDKSIGRLVYKIKGSVCANNYIAMQDLSITGSILHLQLTCQGSGITTIHLEALVSGGLSIRITLSTLYDKDSPRFFGRSLRYELQPFAFIFSIINLLFSLPLPLVSSWTIFILDLPKVIEKYCGKTNGSTLKFNSIKVSSLPQYN